MRHTLPFLMFLCLAACGDPAADQARRALRADILELQVAAEGKINHQDLGHALQRIEAQRRALTSDGAISTAADVAVAALVEKGTLVQRAMSKSYDCRHDGRYLPRDCLEIVFWAIGQVGVPISDVEKMRQAEATKTELSRPLLLKVVTDSIDRDYAPGGDKHGPNADAERQRALDIAKQANDLYFSKVAGLSFDDINGEVLKIIQDQSGKAAAELR